MLLAGDCLKDVKREFIDIYDTNTRGGFNLKIQRNEFCGWNVQRWNKIFIDILTSDEDDIKMLEADSEMWIIEGIHFGIVTLRWIIKDKEVT